jgi:phosphatidylserine decarboxylase
MDAWHTRRRWVIQHPHNPELRALNENEFQNLGGRAMRHRPCVGLAAAFPRGGSRGVVAEIVVCGRGLRGGRPVDSVLVIHFFFRDPDPHVPAAPEAVVAPAHGQVDCVEETTELEFLGSACRRISIFLSVFDVHVQNAPVAGKVALLEYQPGQFLSALKTESAEFNENMLIGIESSEQPGERIAVRQIAGALARRVVAWVKTGDQVARGQRLGLVQYGSRCDLYLPLSAHLVVRPGDKVVGGETVVARRAEIPSISRQEMSIQ